MRHATPLAATLLLPGAGRAPPVPCHPPPHAKHPPTTARGDGHGSSTMPWADLRRAGGMYPGGGNGRALDHRQHGLDPDTESQYGGGAGYGTGAYGPVR